MQTFIIGRNPNVSAGEIPVKINDLSNKVSSNHCRITFDGTHYFIEDLISLNGTYVDGIKVSGRTVVQTNSVIMLGEKHRFSLSELPQTSVQSHYLPNSQSTKHTNFSAKSIHVSTLIHPKEKTYLTLMYIFGGIFWLVVLPFLIIIGIKTFGLVFIVPILVLIIIIITILWSNASFESKLMQNSLKVSATQFPDIYEILTQQAHCLQIRVLPKMFIYNSDGIINAFAIRSLNKKYILLMSAIVDLMLQRKKYNQLAFIIGHELGHHAAGHFSYFKKLVIKPAYFIPFLGAAYSRSKELTADRIGCAMIGDIEDAQYAILSLTSGSITLTDRTIINNFISQQDEISGFVKFLNKLYNHYPSMTRRVEELGKISL